MLAEYYSQILTIHGILRWLVLLAGVAAIGGSLFGKLLNLPFKPLGRSLGLIFLSLLDTQFLTGLLLCLTSPFVHSFWGSPGSSMKVHDLRFFAVEHTLLMVIALALAHIGAVRSRKSVNDLKAHGVAAFWYASSLLLILIGIPWWRPLLRL